MLTEEISRAKTALVDALEKLARATTETGGDWYALRMAVLEAKHRLVVLVEAQTRTGRSGAGGEA